MTRRLLHSLLALAAAMALSACGGPEPVVAEAVFDDVADLAINGMVQVRSVQVGLVKGIELTEDHRARVTMHLDPEVPLPAEVSARLRKTSVLGERFVELVPDPTAGGRLTSGAVITDTAVVPELEEAIAVGTDLVMAISADTLAGAIEAGAVGLDGRGETLGQMLDDLGTVVGAFDDNSDDLVRLIEGLEAFTADVAPQAELHGRALAEAARFAAVLREEDDRLIDALGDVAALSRTGVDIMQTHRAAMDAGLRRFDRITAELVARRPDLDRLFRTMSRHNTNTISGVNAEHAQILLDLILCGVNDTPGDAVRGCEGVPQGQPRPVPRPPQEY